MKGTWPYKNKKNHLLHWKMKRKRWPVESEVSSAKALSVPRTAFLSEVMKKTQTILLAYYRLYPETQMITQREGHQNQDGNPKLCLQVPSVHSSISSKTISPSCCPCLFLVHTSALYRNMQAAEMWMQASGLDEASWKTQEWKPPLQIYRRY